MPKRTTIILDDDVYDAVVRESVKRFGTTKAMSRVVNELLRRGLLAEGEFLSLLYGEKYASIDEEEFYRDRRSLSRALEG
ncbi:MAG: hypothetical protein QXP98_08565 [Thermoproteus sp.]